MTAARTCSVTGLRLVSDPGAQGYHVGKRVHPPLSGAPRDAAARSRHEWGRYDVLGQTFYLAETRSAAYAEVLSGFKRANGIDDALARDADYAGVTLEEYVEEIAREWSERDFMGLGAVPAGWRYDRAMILAALPDSGWLVDVEHPDSLASIERAIGTLLAELQVPHLTTGTLRSEDRAVTTRIAEHLHGLTLDTGGTPLGVHFGSKHGAAWCRALWLDHPDAHRVLVGAVEPVLVTDDDLRTVADRFRIRIF
ncbi:hypothetical protein EDF22_0028 [Rathayibacter sp. PhB127]|nr:hypothetical protein EDF22_0028 [Rathayibacter sp. PhB127]